MVVMSLVIFTWMYSAYFQQSGTTATGTVGVATVTPVPDSIMAAIGTQPTVATQGGGVATTTPASTVTATSPATATSEPAPTETPVPPTEAAVVNTVPTEEPVVDEPATTGAYAFVVWVVEDVWVQITVNGEVVVNDVLPAGSEQIFSGDNLEVTSGNAASVVVYVDGVEYSLGDSWDATFVFP
jgi:hypothetical protein